MSGATSVAALRAAFGGAVERDDLICGDAVVWVAAARSHEILAWLRDTPGQDYNYLVDITAVDYRDPELPLEVCYQVRALARAEDLRVKVALAKDAPLVVESVVNLWRGADWLERETFDMLGIEFEGHPNLRKLLTPEDLDGHPHRKDFPLGETPTLFNDGRFLDPAAFRAGLTGRNPGLTGWSGGARRGVTSTEGALPGEGRDKA